MTPILNYSIECDGNWFSWPADEDEQFELVEQCWFSYNMPADCDELAATLAVYNATGGNLFEARHYVGSAILRVSAEDSRSRFNDAVLCIVDCINEMIANYEGGPK